MVLVLFEVFVCKFLSRISETDAEKKSPSLFGQLDQGVSFFFLVVGLLHEAGLQKQLHGFFSEPPPSPSEHLQLLSHLRLTPYLAGLLLLCDVSANGEECQYPPDW